MITCCGCDPAPPPPPVSTPTAEASQPPEMPEVEPEYTLKVVSSTETPKTYKVVWTAKVNTGGYAFKTERVLIEDDMGKTAARVYATLEAPGKGEMVTQAVTTVQAEYDAGERQIDVADLWVRRMTRNETPEFQPLYGMVKQVR